MSMPAPTVQPDAAGDRYRVVVVDDSVVIRGLLARTLEADPEIRVVDSVGNGQLAIESVAKHDPDVVVLDIEMPVMDGLTALPKILEAAPKTKVIMASTLTRQNAAVSIKALAAGASDYLPKPSSSSELVGAEAFKRELVAKVKALGATRRTRRRPALKARPTVEPRLATPQAGLYGSAPVVLRAAAPLVPEALAIGCSTGGPQALFAIFGDLKPLPRVPIFITQHKPPTFTTILAEHVARISGAAGAEAKDGEPIVAGRVYLAPGDFHMVAEAKGGQRVLRVVKTPPENFCRPAVDPMLRSLVPIYGTRLLTLILTGMGHGGLKGCQAVVGAGGTVIAQDEGTSVVWGMPGAVATGGLCSAVLPLAGISAHLRKAFAVGGAR